MLDLETLLRVPYVDPYEGFDISPDGKQVAFSWNKSGQWEIYLVLLDGSAPPRQVTSGAGAKFSPRFSPDGGRLGYVLDLDGSEAFDLYVYDLNRDRHVNLTPNTPEVLQPKIDWSPDGAQFAFISNRTGDFQVYVMPAGGGSARQVLDLPYPAWDVRWSPDGSQLAVIVEGRGQDYYTYIMPLEGGEAQPIVSESSPINAQGARWSPDGARLAFTSDVHGRYEVGIYEVSTGRIAWVTGGNGDQETPNWSPKGRRLICVGRDGPQTHLEVLDLEEGSTLVFQVGPGIHSAPRFTPDGNTAVFVFDSPRYPADLWALELASETSQREISTTFRKVTQSLSHELQGAPFVMPDLVRYPSPDGVIVPALLYRPLHTQGPSPAVVVVHGGPSWLTQVTWTPELQHMVSRGWVVLAPNYRGSTGYGRTWQLANRFDLGGVDTRDVVAGADYLVQEGLADPARIAVTGRSHGGYLTMTCLTQYPERWAGGSAVVPFLNWFTSHANSREDLQHWDRENFGDPEVNHQLWHDRSPYFFLERVAAPVQLICGANDPRCPATESIQARDQLLALGKQVDFALYPDEGHSFLKIENVMDAEKRRVAFLAQVLEAYNLSGNS